MNLQDTIMDSLLLEKIRRNNQEHLLKYWEELSDDSKSKLGNQLKEIHWEALPELIDEYVINKPATDLTDEISPAPYFPLNPRDTEETLYYRRAVEAGKELIGSGKVAALTVAGGQGTRLGFPGPKGTFPITPVKGKTLFQYFTESLLRAGEKFSSPIPWFIMTSQLNERETRDFFSEHEFFGYDPALIMFFTQGTMPAISPRGSLLLNDKDSIATSPDGHGGTLLALRNSGALDRMESMQIDYISYFQVDNPLVSTVSPLFIGLHHLEESEMSAIMLPKTGPQEKLGNFCIVDGRLTIIEYSDMPTELAEQRDENGRLKFIAGSPAIHVISRDFVARLTENNRLKLPWHRANKKVPYIDENAVLVEPTVPNAVKLETFIFDALPLADKTMILEACREDEFAPTKNPTGVDSVESCRKMLIDRDARWLETANTPVPRKPDGTLDCIIELSPRTFFDVDDAIEAVAKPGFKPPTPGESIYYP